MKNFKKLTVWQKSMILVKNVYSLVNVLPKEEKYGLKSQITRSAISIPSNIAEGSSRSTDKDFKRFLEIALGSSFELETQLLLVKDLKLSDKEVDGIIELVLEVQKMLQSLIKKLY
ncbi:four helix bundle protein [Marinifilum caeruleilacunae]|uniref:Four helix bundle protein n=1 Tax=Marinifilum caeruleilacunae TaxID=2499076 RepID=A0ABX1WZZ0_9BACT|nr:four helix bundle protein [Marinifilum caeruleilacunae]NOU61706.1 four helix bundle protein [Marinifilum caeruleilacunae]